MECFNRGCARVLSTLVFAAFFVSSVCQALPAVWVKKVQVSVSPGSVYQRVTAVSGAIQDVFDAGLKRVEDYRLAEIKKAAESQWAPEHHQAHLRTRMNLHEDEKPQFILFFAHGYRPFSPGYEYAGDRARRIAAPFLKDFSYVAFHPALSVGPAMTTFAQDHDVFQVKYHLDKVIELVKNQDSLYFGLPIVCAGHSNGASTLLALFGTHPELAKSVKGLLLFAPYADVREASILRRVVETPGGHQVRRKALMIAGFGYDDSKPAPVDYVVKEQFPKNLPVFLVHAMDDQRVPFNPNYTLLVDAFKTHGYGQKFHGHAFEKGRHASFALGTKQDRKALRDDLAAFVRQDVLENAHEGVVDPSEPVTDEVVALGSQLSALDRLYAYC